MNKEEHKKRHEELHRALDELLADFIDHTGKLPSTATVMELVQWSHTQLTDPDEQQPNGGAVRDSYNARQSTLRRIISEAYTRGYHDYRLKKKLLSSLDDLIEQATKKP